MTCFQIISNVGMARASFIEAIDCAIDGKKEQAEIKIKEGEAFFLEGHKAHATIIQNEASGGKTEIILLLIHAEDQLMSAESFKILAEKFIRLIKTMGCRKEEPNYE